MNRSKVLEPLGLTIRQYKNTDQASVLALHVFSTEGGAFSKDPGRYEDLHDIKVIYLDPGGEFIVGERNGEVLAMGGLKKLNSSCAEVRRMRVHPNYQRMGVGQALLDILQERAVELGYQLLCLHTADSNTSALAFYRKNSFTETGSESIAGFNCILFEKRLS